jgi:5'-deoxynucleotidase YfbR-like HD superfamily hydrolase
MVPQSRREKGVVMSIEVTRDEYATGRAKGLRRIDILRAGASVQRYHTWRTLRRQTVGEHTHGVMTILIDITPPDLLSSSLLCACAYHDISELLTGDLPSPAKREYPELKKAAHEATVDFETGMGLIMGLSTEQQKLLRFADIMECCLWALEELYMGNRYARRIVANALTYMGESGMPNAKGNVLYMEAYARYQRFMEGKFDDHEIFC